MPDFLNSPHPFLKKVIAAIEENLADEDFGVSELAEQLSMSRSNLLRKIKQETDLSASVFIRQIRLERAKLMLKDESLTISEISYQVGFNSTSYFTKCFRELYGYPPGEEGKRNMEEEATPQKIRFLEQEKEEVPDARNEAPTRKGFLPKEKASHRTAFGIIAVMLLIIVGYFFWPLAPDVPKPISPLDKSIAVLPFKNDSPDSSNVYFMNGLMEAILDNFQKVEDLKVTSRTSVEKYRNSPKSIPEISGELGVSYFVEGSGQKVGNEILLTIQLIEAPSDRHLWSRRYKREVKDIFQLQTEVAKSIASEIGAIVTPEESERMEKIPTNNLVAYDYYLKGRDLLDDETGAGLLPGIEQFKKAIQEDGGFTEAYAYIAIGYYYLDLYQTEKKYGEEMKSYADKAMQLDPELGESLIARGLYFMHQGKFEKAVESLEEVLVYAPNTGWIHNFLSNIYVYNLPNTEKYLSHALQGIQAGVAGQDSVTASYSFLHLSNALAQTGFIKEAETYIEKSLAYNPRNYYSEYLKVYLQLAQHLDMAKAKASLQNIFQKDTSRLDVLQEIAKVSYTLKDYEEAGKYYQALFAKIEALELNIYTSETIKVYFVLNQLGKTEEAQEYLQAYYEYAKADQSIYKDLSLSAYYACTGETQKGIEHLKGFSEVENYQYWFVLFLEKDPIMLQLASHPEFKPTLHKINDKFWNKHKEIRAMLDEEGII